jgi:hypothetical protein
MSTLGWLAFSAQAKHTGAFRDSVLWFAATLRREVGQDNFEVVWERDWDGPGGWAHVRRDAGAVLTLPETQIPLKLPPGSYSLLVELREDAATMTPDGRLLEPAHAVAGESVWVEIPGQ